MSERLVRHLLDRRQLLVRAGALTAVALTGAAPVGADQIKNDPFTLGIASGDFNCDGFVLWTRLAPEPLNGGGMPPHTFPVHWEVSLDERFTRVHRRGVELARPDLAHSVHAVVGGLEAGRPYWYRFRVGKWESSVGRTRTAPALNSRPNRLAFAFASCQDWQNGLYAAYAAMAREDLDFVIHLGDYIYEYGPQPNGPRQHNSPEIMSLTDYRNRYALYKSDPSLKAVHAAFPFLVTPDDHEVENDYAGALSENDDPIPQFLQRRAAAYQAYYEHMPLRLSSLPVQAFIQLYRRFRFGDLAEISLLDTRQFRTNQPCEGEPEVIPGTGLKPRCPESEAPTQTMTGQLQEDWLLSGLDRSHARWNVIGQQTMMAEYDFLAGPGSPPFLPGELFNMDQWDGYAAQRRRIMAFLNGRRPSNPVVLTGDIHSSWVHDLKVDFSDAGSPVVGTEFIGTSITSSFPQPFIAPIIAALPDNPHTRYFDGANRGYVRCVVTRDEWRTDFRGVPTAGPLGGVFVPDAPATTLASFVVEDGQPGAQVA